MEWSKIKTIILIILAGTNLLLLSFVLRQDLQKRTVQLQARQEAVAFLEKNVLLRVLMISMLLLVLILMPVCTMLFQELLLVTV